MKKDLITDYCGYLLLKVLGPVFRFLPIGIVLFLGRRIGDMLYYFDRRHRAIAYANLKAAFGDKMTAPELMRLTKKFYRSFGQNIVDLFLIPLVDKKYIDKYISFVGSEHIREGFKKGKGVIFLGVHEGSWEFYNMICANLGFPFSLFVRGQRYPRISGLLNDYRRMKGCRIIEREKETRRLIELFRNNEAVGMSVDQGGKNGVGVKFFNKDASMSSGAIRLALKYDVALTPSFYVREHGPYFKIIIEPPFEIKKTGNLEADIHDNLERLVSLFQKHIANYPQEYLWYYKIWKYSAERNILLLSDSKPGHLRQAEAVANLVSEHLREKKINVRLERLEVKFKNKFAYRLQALSACLSAKYSCQGCLWCLKAFLEKDTFNQLAAKKPDIIISCGSSLAGINFILSRENQAKSIVVMRPSVLSTKRFDLMIMPRHDKPPAGKNVVITEGALNLITEPYLKEQSVELIRALPSQLRPDGFYLGLLIGGDTKNFRLEKETIALVLSQLKEAAQELNAEILTSTSRRTSSQIEALMKSGLGGYGRSKLLVIANERNLPSAVGGILGLSRVVIISPESISMISEAVSSGKYVIVFKDNRLGGRHKRLLEHFAENKYIHLIEPVEVAKIIKQVLRDKPQIHTTKNNLLIKEALTRVL